MAPPPAPPRPGKTRTRATRRRYIPSGAWVHLSARTLQGRYAFVPRDALWTGRAWGLVAVAQEKYDVELCAFQLMSNHYHALVRGPDRAAVSQFAQYVEAGLARLTHEYHGTHGTVFDGRFRSTTLLDDESALWWLRYILAHGTKESIVPSPKAWPGPQSATALADGTPVVGLRLDRARYNKARAEEPGTPIHRADFMQELPVQFTPLDAWAGDPNGWRRTCDDLVTSIVVEHALSRFLGAEAAAAMAADFVPTATKRSRATVFDARGPKAIELLREAKAARRLAIEASEEALIRMVQAGRRAAGGLPDGISWPALIADALSAPSREIPAGGRETGASPEAVGDF